MANTLRFKRGLVAGIPTALAGEPLFTTDTFDLYIGNGTTNTRFQKYIASGTTSQLLRGDGSLLTMPIVLTSPSNGQVLKYDGTNWVNSSDAGVTGSGANGQVTFWDSASTITGSNNLFWNSSLNRLGILTNLPTSSLHLQTSSSSIAGSMTLTDATGKISIGHWDGANNRFEFTGRNTYFIQYGASNHIAFGTNGAERMRLDASGNLLVGGTSVYAATITSYGSSTRGGGLGIRNSAGTVAGYFGTYAAGSGSGSTDIFVEAAGFMLFSAGGSERMKLYSATGNFAIGSTASDTGEKLQVNGTMKVTGASTFGGVATFNASTTYNSGSVIRSDNGTAAAPSISFESDLNTGIYRISNDILGIATGGAEQFRITGTGATFSSSVTAGGLLTVNGGTLNSTAIFTHTGTDGGIDIRNTGTLATIRSSQIRLSNGSTFYGANDRSYQLINLGTSATASAFTIQYWDGSSYFERMRIDATGNVGIGTTALTGYNLRINKNITGATVSYGIVADGQVQSTVTVGTINIWSNPSVAASTTTTNLYHIRADQGVFGAGSSVTNQVGFWADSSLTGATNNFGFRGEIASGTGRWNLYMNGSASNFISGSLGIGSTALTGYNLRINKDLTGATSSFGVSVGGQILSDVTSTAALYQTSAVTQAATFILTNLNHFRASQGTLGATSVVTNQHGYFVDASLTGATNNFGFFGNIAAATGRWNLYMNGTAANYLAGTLSIGTTTATYGLNLGGATAASNIISSNSPSDYSVIFSRINSASGWTIDNVAGSMRFYLTSYRGGFFTNGNFQIGNMSSDTGELLQVNGTMKVTGAASIGGTALGSAILTARGHISIAGGQRLYLWNTANSTAPYISNSSNDITFYTNTDVNALSIASTGAATFSSSVTAGGNLLLTNGTASSIGAINLIRTGTSPVASRLTFGTDGTGYSFAIGKNQAGSVTDLFSILDSGAANFSTSIQAATAIAIGTTPDTNKPFKILKNINATVGINFENTSTSSLAFSAIQMGTDVTGGTKFTNLVYASSGVAASGVYNPDGTSLINNGSGGLNFLGNPIRLYTGGSNGVLRLMLDNEGTTQYTATTPTTNATDGYKQYSADVVAGNAAPHFRTENGAVIKLYQETTGVGNAIFSAGGGTGVLDDSTFDGYTLRQIVKALRNQGILA